MKLKQLTPLLKKLSALAPCGKELTHSPLYDEIKKLRARENNELPKGVWQENESKADWYRIDKICTHVLCHESKDLQVAIWLSEAWFFLYGLNGFFQGIHLISGLLENFWDTLYPCLETPEDRGHLLSWFSKIMADALLTLHISEPHTPGLDVYSFADHVDAQYLDSLSQKQKDPQRFLQREGRPLKKDVQKSISDTLITFYDTLAHDLHKVQDVLRQLEQFFIRKVGNSQEGCFRELDNQLTDICDTLPTFKRSSKTPPQKKNNAQSVLRALKKGLNIESFPAPIEKNLPENNKDTPETTNTHSKNKDAVPPLPPLSSRHNAYALLKEIDLYLAEQDPQSPVPHLLKRIHTWENKSFPEIANDFKNPSEAFLWLSQFCQKSDKAL